MNSSNQHALPTITMAEAKKSIDKMTLINGFLFDSTLENADDAQIVVGGILRSIFNRDFKISISSQKTLQPVDSKYHGIRLDVHITESGDDSPAVATIFDIEMEDRASDKAYLPKRLRYYVSLNDTKKLDSGEEYNKLPDFVSIVILSYDPFDAGDMYYEARSVITTHPSIEYKDGIKHIFLYCNGNPNFDSPDSLIQLPPEHSKKLQAMLKYIVSGEITAPDNPDINDIEKVVTKVKSRKEVTIAYMRQWERELSIKREERLKDALEVIRFGREDGIPDDKTRIRLRDRFALDDQIINELFEEADKEAALIK